jgi:hypothetical protein
MPRNALGVVSETEITFPRHYDVHVLGGELNEAD